MFRPGKLKDAIDRIKAIQEAQRKKDPDYIFADVSKRQFDRYERDFKPFEVGLIGRAQEDTSLIDIIVKPPDLCFGDHHQQYVLDMDRNPITCQW